MIAALFRLFGRPDPGVCRCGHPTAAHEHHRPGSDCGACGAGVCRRYRPARARRDVDTLRTDQVIEAVQAGDIDHALLLAPPKSVALLVALRDLREEAR